jgi:hypothetical protein
MRDIKKSLFLKRQNVPEETSVEQTLLVIVVTLCTVLLSFNKTYIHITLVQYRYNQSINLIRDNTDYEALIHYQNAPNCYK